MIANRMTPHGPCLTTGCPAPRPLISKLPLIVIGILVTCSYFFEAASRGVWYDENWSIYLSQHDVPLGSLLTNRWLREINPPGSFLLGWLAAPIAGDRLLPYRLTNLFPAALLLATLILMGRRCRRFSALFGILVFTNPWSVRYFAEFRSYFSQICCAGSVIAGAYYMFTSPNDLRRTDITPLVLPAAGTLIVLNLHYIGAYLSAAMLVALVLGLFIQRKPRFAFAMATTAMAGLTLMAGTYVAQHAAIASETNVAHFWTKTSNLKAVALVGGMLALSMGLNLPALWAAFLGFKKGPGSDGWGSVRAFVCWSLVAAAAMAAAALVLNFARPALVARYLTVLVPTSIAPLAALGTIFPTDFLASLILANAALLAVTSGYKVAQQQKWSAGARFIAEHVQRCGGTVVHTVPHWQLEPGPPTILPNEIEMNQFSYERIGRVFGFRPEPPESRTTSATCDTIIWAGHFYLPPPAPAFAAARVGLSIPPESVERAQSFNLADGVLVVFPPARKAAGQ